MSDSPLLARAVEYAQETGVRFRRVARRAGWSALGLPDLRGFTPNRRTVRLYRDESGDPKSFVAGAEVAPPWRRDARLVGLDEAELWLLHDLLHVVWYDFASLAPREDSGTPAAARGDDSPARRWAQRDFFLEQHLASEAFAVLLLDYHALVHTERHGLAVDLAAEDWEELRRRRRDLPELRSYAFCRELVHRYLAGASRLFDAAVARDAGFERWRGHEVRYSDKQRWYVFLWWDDLNGAPLSNRQAVVEESRVAESLWLAIRLFTVESESTFRAHVARVRESLRRIDDLFVQLPKLQLPRAVHDFRFTDAGALPRERLAAIVRAAAEPDASTLFLFWQLLALASPDERSAADRAAIRALANSAQTPHVDVAAWSAVRAQCERLLSDATRATTNLEPDPSGLAAFFLP